jgi:hypothetical protein
VVRIITMAMATIFVVGLLLTVILAYNYRTVVEEHATIYYTDGYLEMGPYDPGLYEWSLWVEDIYPGQGGDGWFIVFASEDPPADRVVSDWIVEYETQEFAGVECEYANSWDPGSWAEDEVYFCIEWPSSHDVPKQTAEVFLVKQGNRIASALIAVTLMITVVGLVLFIYFWWMERQRETPKE